MATTLRDLGLEQRSAAAPATTLRDFGLVPQAAPDVSQIVDETAANGMGQLRKGYTSGVYGGDANLLAAEQMNLRAAGRHAEADALGQRITALQGRAATFAPAEQDVTKLGWNPGRILDYGLGAVGQAGASMQDPIAMSAAGNAASSLVSAIPHPAAKAVGLGLRGAGLLGGYYNMARQATGEFYEDAKKDPELMRNNSAQEIANKGNTFGAVSGLVDTMLPGAIGGRLVGKTGMKALAGLGMPAKLALDAGLEGGQELTQGMGKRATLGLLNPNRDTSGDTNDAWNDFAGGVAGGGGIGGASHVVNHALTSAMNRKGVVDDTSSNDVSGKAVPPKNENLTQSMVRAAKENTSGAQEKWHNTLMGVPDENNLDDIDTPINTQHAALTKELTARAAKGDATAQQHLDALSAMQPGSADWYDEGPRSAAATHIMGDGQDHSKFEKAYKERALNTQGFQTVNVGNEEVAVGAPIAPGELGKGKQGGVKIERDSPEMQAAVEERRAVKQRAALTGRIMSDAVASDAKPQLKKVAASLGAEIAEFAGSGYKKPLPGDVARVQRMAAQMVYLYGGVKAAEIVKKVAATSGAQGTPLMQAMTASVAAARDTHIFAKQQRVARDTAAQQLVQAIPPRAQLTLHRAGLDLTTEGGRAALLAHVEDFFDGESTRSAMAFNTTFGKHTVEAMRQIVGQRLEPRIEPMKEAASKGADTADTTSPTESDEVGSKTKDEADAEEDADWENKNARENAEKAPGTSEYFSKGKATSTPVTAGGHPFVRDSKTKNLPTLSRIDDENEPLEGHTEGINTLHRVEETAYQAMGADMGKPLGNTRIRTVSAKEVMDKHGVGKDERAQLLRQYLARMKGGKVTLSMDDPTIQQLQTTDSRIAKLEKTTPKELTVAVGPNGAKTKENPKHAALRDMKGLREEAASKFADKIGIEYKAGMSVADMANAYFAEHFLVVAEQMADKDQLRLQPAEVMKMIRRGNDDLDFSDQGKKDGTQAQMQADMNLIRFKSPRAVSKDGVAVVRAADLVRWVYANRNDAEKPAWNSGNVQAHAFRSALMEGIGALAADGFMDGLPWMVNAKGQTESFSKGFPPSLRLVGTTQGRMDFGAKERAKSALAKQGPLIENSGNMDPEAVAREQAKETPARNTNPDELVDEGHEAARPTHVDTGLEADQHGPRDPLARTETTPSERYWDAPAALPADEVRQRAATARFGGPEGDAKKARVAAFPVAPETVDTRRDTDRVASETVRKQTKGVPTEVTDLAMRNAVQDAALPKIDTITPTNAFSKGAKLAEGVWGMFRDQRAGAYARLQALVSALGHPVYRHGDENAPVGGLHYAAPLAMLLTPEHVARLVATAKDGAAAQQKLDGMRAQVAQALLDAKKGVIPLHEKVKLTRLLAGDARISAVGTAMDQALKRIAAQAQPVVAKPEAAPKVESEAMIRPWRPEDGEGTELSSRSAGVKGLVHAAVGTAKAGRSLNTQTGVPSEDGQRRLVTRLAAARKGDFASASTEGVEANKIGGDSFGPFGRAFTYYFTVAQAATHTAVVPDSIVPRLERFLANTTDPEQIAKALGFFSVQHVVYEQDTGNVTTFGPRPDTPGAEAIRAVGAMGEANALDGDGKPLTRVEGVSDRETLNLLATALAYSKHVAGKDELHVNWERATGAKKGKTGGGVFNAQSTPAEIQSPEAASPSDERIAAAKAYIAKVLGPKVTAQFIKDFDAAGEWVKADNLIKLSLTGGPGLMTVARHEAMHAFFDGLLEHHPKAAEALKNILGGEAIYERLKGLLANEPTALEQIKNDPAERVAYAFQFWAAGALDVDKPATTMFDKFRKFLRKVLGMVRESETALDIITAFHEGKAASLGGEESPAGRVIKEILARETWNEDAKRRFDTVVQKLHAAVAPSNDVLRREVMSATARELGLTMFTNPGEQAAGGSKEGYINARARVGRQFSNRLYQVLKGLSDRDQFAAIEMLQNGQKPEEATYAPVGAAVKGVYGLLQRYREHAVGAGLNLENLGDNYFPRIWDLSKLIEGDGKDRFTAMLMDPKYDKKLATMMAVINANRDVAYTKEEVVSAMHRSLVDRGGVDEQGMEAEAEHDDLILKPFFASSKERHFKWLKREDVTPFLEKDLVGAMSRYLHQGVRAAEFARRFGDGGGKLKAMLKMKGDSIPGPDGQMVDAAEHGPIAREMEEHLKEKGVEGAEADKIIATHMNYIKNAVAAHEGSIGGDISPTFRKFSSAAMAYQNLRLLPMALFSAVADTAAIAARGPGLKGAYEAFIKGLTDVYARWKDAASDTPAVRKNSLWDDIAETVGAVDSHMFLEQMGKAHTSEFMTNFARNSNRKLFMLNGLTAWDRSMRVSATKFAVQFLEAHKSLPDAQHSARWLKELGLKPADIHLDGEGKLIWNRNVLQAETGMGQDEATKAMEKTHYAITRWVEGAVLSPNAAQRPSWGSDPRWAVLFHLKQFTYSMQHTVLKRAFNEASEGNMNPIGALAAGIPIMMASDIVKGLVQGGGSLPTWQHGMDLGDRVKMAAQRAGLAGVGQFGIDALHDPAGILGPTVGQVANMAFHPGDLGSNLVDAVPGLRYVKPAKDLVLGAE